MIFHITKPTGKRIIPKAVHRSTNGKTVRFINGTARHDPTRDFALVDFETIYYVIKTNERITIEVIDENKSGKKPKEIADLYRFNEMIDSADVYLKKDAERSIKFIGDALNVDVSSGQSAEAHELLGDVYGHWKQYDLAISAYKISLQNTETASAKLKLARAYLNSGNFQMSISTYQNFDEAKLSNYEKVLLYEGLGDANAKLKYFSKAASAH